MRMKTIFITGIGKGIGKALAAKFLAEGHFVIGTYRDSEPEAQENLAAIPLDLADGKSIERCVAAVEKIGRKMDILINNAGVVKDEEETHVIIEKLRDTLEVNLIGTVDLTERLLPFVAQGGHIINISSSAGSLTDSDFETSSHYPFHYPAYKISKAALNMYTRTLAMNLKHEGADIIVSSVHPGWVRTEMGGEDADISPEEAAEDIFRFSLSRPSTGGFWYRGKLFAW